MTFNVILGEMVILGEIEHATRPVRFTAIGRRIARTFELPERDYLGNEADAESLIPAGWTKTTVTETRPGQYSVELTRTSDQKIVKFPEALYGLPLAIAAAAVFARGHEWGYF